MPNPRQILRWGLAGLGAAALLAGAAALLWKANISGAQFSFAPALSPCLLIPGMLAAIALSAILYRDQRRMAPLGRVLLLSGLRVMLIVLIALLFLQPALRWTSTKTSAGTLWLVMDQSPSMQTSDPQATDIERLHWAEGMGYVTRPTHLDELAARVHVMTDELAALIPQPNSGAGGEAEERQVAALADAIAAWAKDVDKLRRDADTAGVSDAAANLSAAQQLASENAAAIRHATSLWTARLALRDFNIGQSLTAAQKILDEKAVTADALFLHDQKGSAQLLAADARMANLDRGAIAYGVLGGSDAPGAKTLNALVKQYRLRIANFSDKAEAVGMVDQSSLDEALKASLVPAGQSTNISSALQFVAEQVQTGEAASVVIVTDGRSNTGGDPTATARNLAARGVHVYGLMVGSREMSPDAAVEPVDFPDWIYSGDTIKPRALIRLDGLTGKSADVELLRDGVVLQHQPMTATTGHELIPFDFSDKPPDSDKIIEYEIRVSQMPGEVNTQNNSATFRVAVKKDKLAALVIEDRPRWEFRYLAAYLSQRQGFKLQTVLLQPALIAGVALPPPVLASPDNPRTEAQRLPETLEGWEKFDLIVVGDVGPEVITPQMQQFIAAAVRDKGATVVAIAGQRSMPAKYGNSPLADILPVTLNPQWTAEQINRHTRQGFQPQPAPTAGVSVLAQLGTDTSANSRAWQGMPQWYWHSNFTEAKPAAAVLWSIPGLGAAAGEADPIGTIAEANRHALISTMTIGLGHSLYLASDQTWRLRQVGGLNLHDRFWGQVLNWAVGSDLPAGGKYVRFGTNQPTYEQTQPVVVTARILKDDLTPYTGLGFSAVARPKQGAGGTVEANFSPMESPGYYQATLAGLPIGDEEISLKGGEVERLLSSDPTVTLKTLVIKVFPTQNLERQNMNTDAAMLEAIARAGAGYSVDAPYAGLLLSRMPKIQHTETSAYQLGFFTDPDASGTYWAHWGFFGLFVLLLTLEWIVRKMTGLV